MPEAVQSWNRWTPVPASHYEAGTPNQTRREVMASTSAPSIQIQNVDDILQQVKIMQETSLKMMKGMQNVNMENTLIQGMNNMFNDGIHLREHFQEVKPKTRF
jgi:hypothetical protein